VTIYPDGFLRHKLSPSLLRHRSCFWLQIGEMAFRGGEAADNRSIGLAVGRLNVRHRIAQNAGGIITVVHCPEARHSKRFLDVRCLSGNPLNRSHHDVPRHRHDILHLCWRQDLPVPRGLFGRHDLTIVAKDHVRADVAMSRAGRDASLPVILTGSCSQ